jgi:hypothetical protein
MSRRSWILAAQAVAVAVLVMIVYMTLLRPESDEPLRGISTPGPERAGVPDEAPKPKPRRDRERKADGRHRDDANRSGIRTQAEVSRSGPAPQVTASVGGAPLGRVVTPRSDQYADAVASLLGKVESAVPPGAG